jgi:hypothetical protein
MSKKGLPLFVYIFILIAFTLGLSYYGGLMVRKNFVYADVTLDDYGIVILNRDKQKKDWVGGTIYFNKIGDVKAVFGPVKADTSIIIPYVAFEGIVPDEGSDSFEIKKIIISMEGYQDKYFPRVAPHTLSLKKPEAK